MPTTDVATDAGGEPARNHVGTVRVSVTRRDADSPPLQENMRAAFWGPIVDRFRDNQRPSLELLETRLEKRLGQILRARLVRERFGIGYRIPPAQSDRFADGLTDILLRHNAAEELIVKARIFGYGSLQLDLLFGTVDKLATVFGGSVDYFELFLEAAVPYAFFEAVLDSGEISARARDELESEYRFHAVMPADFIATFSASRRPRVSVATESAPRLSRRDVAWIVANTSLILPVLLTLGVLYLFHQSDTTSRKEAEETRRLLFSEQMQLLRDERSTAALPGTSGRGVPKDSGTRR